MDTLKGLGRHILINFSLKICDSFSPKIMHFNLKVGNNFDLKFNNNYHLKLNDNLPCYTHKLLQCYIVTVLIVLMLLCILLMYSQGNVPPDASTDTHEIPRRTKLGQQQFVSLLVY